jgi:hypothetical protein
VREGGRERRREAGAEGEYICRTFWVRKARKGEKTRHGYNNVGGGRPGNELDLRHVVSVSSV